MTGARVVGAEELRALLPIRDAIAALASAFRDTHRAVAPPRVHHVVPGGELLLMPAAGEAGVGVKVVSIAPENPGRGLPLIHALYALFDAQTLRLEAVIEGGALTALRTAAVSALATTYLARADARRLVLFGAGTQAAAHLEAMLAVRQLEGVVVVSRTTGPAERLAERAHGLGLAAEVAGPEAVEAADLVCTCTTSDRPVFDGARLPDGAHVNAIGAYRPEARELDDDVIRRARIVVETREAALAEAGDLLIPMAGGVISAAGIVADLSELVRGATVRTSERDITVFKSVGLALEDLAIARAAADRL